MHVTQVPDVHRGCVSVQFLALLVQARQQVPRQFTTCTVRGVTLCTAWQQHTSRDPTARSTLQTNKQPPIDNTQAAAAAVLHITASHNSKRRKLPRYSLHDSPENKLAMLALWYHINMKVDGIMPAAACGPHCCR